MPFLFSLLTGERGRPRKNDTQGGEERQPVKKRQSVQKSTIPRSPKKPRTNSTVSAV